MENVLVRRCTALSREGMVTLPLAALEAAGIRPGDEIVLYQMGDEIHVERHDRVRTAERVAQR